MELFLLSALSAAGLAALGWRQLTSKKRGPAERFMDEDAEIALHVARHASSSRGQSPTPLHILFGLLQNDEIRDAIRSAGEDPERAEDRVLDALDDPEQKSEEATGEEAARVVTWSVHVAGGAGRPARCADLWAGLVKFSPDALACVVTGRAKGAEILVSLVHGGPKAQADGARLPERGEVDVVVANDDVTSAELVVDILREEFGLEGSEAVARMREAHHEGSARFGPFSAADAGSRLEQARDRARAEGSPLYLAGIPASLDRG